MDLPRNEEGGGEEKMQGCPDRGLGAEQRVQGGHRPSRGPWDPPLQLPTQAEIPFSGPTA